MARTRKRAVFVDTESTYGADPSANGSGYVWVPAFEIGELADGKEPIPTNYATARNFETAPIAGPDGWSFDMTVPLIGLATAAGDGTNASSVTDDWLDALLTHIYGSQSTTAGEGVSAGSTTSTIQLDTDVYDVQQLVPIYEASKPSATEDRTQWALVTVDNGSGSYDVAPTLEAAPTTSGVAYGVKEYQFDDDGGSSLAFVYRDDDLDYTLLGGRCTSASINFEAGGRVEFRLSFRGDTRTQETKGSLPANGASGGISSGPAITPLVGLLSPVWFNGTEYETDSVTIDLAIQAAVRAATAGTNGRGEDVLITGQPSVTVRPLRTDAINNLKRNQTKGRLLVQLGGGVLSGGVLNAQALHAEEATARVVTQTDENGRRRAEIQFTTSDRVAFSSGVNSRFWQHVRA